MFEKVCLRTHGRELLVLVAAAVCVGNTASPALARTTRARISVHAPRTVRYGARLRVTGRVTGGQPAGSRVRLEQLDHGAYRARASARLSRSGRFTLTWAKVPNASVLRVRVVVARGGRRVAVSKTITIAVLARAGGGAPVTGTSTPSGPATATPRPPATTIPRPTATNPVTTTTPTATTPTATTPTTPTTPTTTPPPPAPVGATVVPDPATVAGAPAPGEDGQVAISGGSTAKAGDVIAVGIGPSTPYGFLGEVTAVHPDAQGVVLDTTPATLPQAIPDADVDQTFDLQDAPGDGAPAGTPAGHTLRFQADRAADCGGGKPLDLSATLDITPVLHFEAHWSLAHGVSSASLTAGGKATATVSLVDAAAVAQCSYEKTLWTRTLKPIEFSIGPVPVVIVPVLHADLKLEASIGSKLSTAVHGSVTFDAGVSYTSKDGVSPVGSVDASLAANPPTIEGSADASAHVVPAIDARFYGAGGPSLELETGLDFNAAPDKDPWWTLDAPLTTNLAFVFDVLGLKVHSTVHLASHTFHLRHAPGRAPGAGGGGTGGGTGGGGPGPGDPGSGVMTWSPITQLDTPYQGNRYGNWLAGISCPSVQLCAAIDNAGNIMTSTDPLHTSWTTTLADPQVGFHNNPCGLQSICFGGGGNGLQAISCPSASLCVGADIHGDVVWSTHPGDPSVPWTVDNIDSNALLSLSCPTETRCVAGDNAGNILVSDDPSGGASGWWSTDAGQGDVYDVACPTANRCFATSGYGGSFGFARLMTTDDPDDPSAWTDLGAGANHSGGLSCPTVSMCVMSDGQSGVLSSADPATKGTWRYANVSSEGAYYWPLGVGISCTTDGYCVLPGGSSDAWISSDPTSATPTWTEVSQPDYGSNLMTGVDCVSRTACFAVDASGGVIATTTPATPHWATVLDDKELSFGPISCASAASCVAIDVNGYAFATTTGQAEGPWSARSFTRLLQPGGLSCRPGICVGVNAAPTIALSTAPTSASPVWRSTTPSGVGALIGVSCVSTALCVAIDDDGRVTTSTNPLAASPTWTPTTVEPAGSWLTTVDCPSTSLCVAVDRSGRVLTSTSPATGVWSAPATPGTLATGERVDSVSCPSASLCVAVTSTGDVITSTNPAAPAPTWSEPVSITDHALGRISCASATLCAVLDGGSAFTSTDPTGAADQWTSSGPIDTHGGLASISCAGDRCLATDYDGGVIDFG
jgi:hypothetical protein